MFGQIGDTSQKVRGVSDKFRKFCKDKNGRFWEISGSCPLPVTLVTESFTCYMQGALIDINSHDNFSEIETELLPGLARTPNQPGLASSHHLCINT